MSDSIIDRLKNLSAESSAFDYRNDSWGILLINMGGPETISDIKPYLLNIFSDPLIIKLPISWLLQKPLAYLIANLRSPKVAKRYELIGGGSPLVRYNHEVANSLSEVLTSEYKSLRCYVGMSYSNPFIADALAAAVRDGCRRLVILPMFPHYCLATTGTALEAIASEIRKHDYHLPLQIITDYHDHPGYIKLLRDRIVRTLESLPSRDRTRLIFSAHSIPEQLRDSGDPYVTQIEKSCSLAGAGFEYLLTFQSATGPVKWVGPDTLATLETLAIEGVEQIVIVPISFVFDNIETLYDVDIIMAQRCKELGMKPLLRAACFNGDRDFVQFLADLISVRISSERT